MIFDSHTNIARTQSLIADVAYRLVVEAKVDPGNNNTI